APWNQLQDLVPVAQLADLAVPDHASGTKKEISANGCQPDLPERVRASGELQPERNGKGDHSGEKKAANDGRGVKPVIGTRRHHSDPHLLPTAYCPLIPGWTHSSVPSAQDSRFQIGTTSFSVSIIQRQASKAWLRWGQLTATTTLISPRSR